MPYKDKNKEKERLRLYYQKNKELVKKRASDFYYKNKESILTKRKDNPEHKERCKTWRIENKKKVLQYKKKYQIENRDSHLKSQRKRNKRDREKLSNHYVIHIIKNSTGLSVSQIKNNPEFLESHKQQIKLKRLIKNKKRCQKQ